MLMTLVPSRSALENTVLSLRHPEELIQQLVSEIAKDLLAHSQYIKEPQFRAIHPRDLELLFSFYDKRLFAGLLQRALAGRNLTFRLAPRMTRAGGTTTKKVSRRSGQACYEIAISSSLLFDGFRNNDRDVTVSGVRCQNRLEALQRIFEHELVHLIEQLCWESSNCAAGRFQYIARRLFLHQAHTHHLITRRERAAESGIRPGSRVTFIFEGRRLMGRVNRITKRATVLVEDPEGRKFSDGGTYKVYYVPISSLQPFAADETGPKVTSWVAGRAACAPEIHTATLAANR
jgi:hypothetical protein